MTRPMFFCGRRCQQFNERDNDSVTETMGRSADTWAIIQQTSLLSRLRTVLLLFTSGCVVLFEKHRCVIFTDNVR